MAALRGRQVPPRDRLRDRADRVAAPSRHAARDAGAAEVLVLATTAVFVVLSCLPLARHLWQTPTGFPEHVPHEVGVSPELEALVDRYATRWGFGERRNEERL